MPERSSLGHPAESPACREPWSQGGNYRRLVATPAWLEHSCQTRAGCGWRGRLGCPSRPDAGVCRGQAKGHGRCRGLGARRIPAAACRSRSPAAGAALCSRRRRHPHRCLVHRAWPTAAPHGKCVDRLTAVRPGLVEGPSFLLAEKQVQGFDELSPNGI